MPRSSPFRGKYLFHVHTNLTDGESSAEDYFRCALALGIERIVFLEHICRDPSYDVEALVALVERLGAAYGVEAHVGFEAKIRPDGSVDVRDEHRRLASVIGIAEHGFHGTEENLKDAFEKAVARARTDWHGQVTVWVHPGLWFKKRQIDLAANQHYRSMLNRAVEGGLFLERNQQYQLLPPELVKDVPADHLVVGVDAHHVRAVQQWWQKTTNGRRASLVRKRA